MPEKSYLEELVERHPHGTITESPLNTIEGRNRFEKSIRDARNKIKDEQYKASHPAPTNFQCLVCGSTKKPQRQTKNNGILGPAGRSWTVSFSCLECGVVIQANCVSKHTQKK